MTIHRTPHNITPLAQSNSSLWLNSCYAKQESLHILQLKRQGTNWQRKFRLHIPCGVVLFLVQFETASVQLWYSPGKGLVGRAVTACPREALSEKAAISNISKQNHLKQKANRIIYSGFFFSPWCSTPKIQLFSHRDANNRNNNKIMLGDDEAPQQGLWRNSQSCLKGVLWDDHTQRAFYCLA